MRKFKRKINENIIDKMWYLRKKDESKLHSR